jgi:hypothetical protein
LNPAASNKALTSFHTLIPFFFPENGLMNTTNFFAKDKSVQSYPKELMKL